MDTKTYTRGDLVNKISYKLNMNCEESKIIFTESSVKELEKRYEKIDAEYKKLIVQEVRERNPVKLLALEERTSKLFKQMRDITKELRGLIEAEKNNV